MTDRDQPTVTAGAHTMDLTVTFASDWGVGTGTGVAGGVDAVVERDSQNRPVVRGSVLTGILREQAANAAHALDAGKVGEAGEVETWAGLATRLFGDRDHAGLLTVGPVPITVTPRQHPTQTSRPSDGEDSHEVVSLSIDPRTGTAKQDHLRLIERAGAGHGTGTLTFLNEADGGAAVTWKEEALADARLLVSLGAALVRSIGSDRSNGDGRCTLIVSGPGEDPPTPDAFRTWCRGEVEKRRDTTAPKQAKAPNLPDVAALPAPVLRRQTDRQPAPDVPSSVDVVLTLTLDSPVISYDVPMSNEVSSLDFLRGTVLLPWVHGRLRRAMPDDEAVRDAVVAGHLQVSDALPVVDGVRGLPAPMVLSRPKIGTGDDSPVTYSNRLRVGEPEDVHVPLREGYLFLPAGEATATGGGVVGALGRPALTGRQSTAIDACTGSAQTGQLYLVRAIPAGVVLQATVTVRADLVKALGDRPAERLTELLGGDALLGAKRRSGTYGAVHCEVGSVANREDPPSWCWDQEEGTTTLWLTSDLLLRSRTLGTGSGTEDLLAALREAGADLVLHPAPSAQDPPGGTDGAGQRFSASLRYRRIDAWHAAARRPRPTRVAVKAGSVLRVAPASPDGREAAFEALSSVARHGLGHLGAEGYGRVVVGHPFLAAEEVSLRPLHQSDFLTGGADQ